MIDDIEDTHGLRPAHHRYAVIRRVMNWSAARDDDYAPPIMRGMRLESPSPQARARVLTTTKSESIWNAADQGGAFGAHAQIALLTAQRRDKVAAMKWADIKDGVWTIRSAPGEKNTAATLALPEMALPIIDAQPQFDSNPFAPHRRPDQWFLQPRRPSTG